MTEAIMGRSPEAVVHAKARAKLYQLEAELADLPGRIAMARLTLGAGALEALERLRPSLERRLLLQRLLVERTGPAARAAAAAPLQTVRADQITGIRARRRELAAMIAAIEEEIHER